MATCEKCGTSFAGSPRSGEVSSVRVLCPSCDAERTAARASGASPGAGAPVAPRGAAPPVQRPHASPPPAARPAPAAVRRPPSAVGPHALARRGASKYASHASPVLATQRVEQRTMQIAWVVTVLLVVAAGIAVLVAKQKRDVRVAREQTLRKAQTEFTDALRTASKGTNEADWEAALRLILDKPALANDPAIAADVGILQSQLRSKLDAAQEKKGTMDGFAAIESALGNREALTVGAIEELRRKLDDLGPKAKGVGPEFVARFGLARKTLDQVYLEKAREEPKAFAATNPDKGRVALGKYAHAEDVLRQLLEKALRDQDKEMGSLAERLYRETIQESDALCARVFTRDAIEKTPWRDLLSGEGAQSWASSPLKGFSHRIDGGVLTITGPDPGVGKEGVLSIGDREQWRDFVLDVEFTLDQGEPTLFFRMPRDTRAVERSAQYPFVMGAKGIAPGKSYTLSVSFVGSRLQEQIAGSEIAPTEEEVKWGLSRKGAVAFAIPEGTRMRITRMRIRELR